MTPAPSPPGSIVKGILTSLLCQFIAMCIAGGLAAAVSVAKMEKTRQDFVGILLVGAWGFISWGLVELAARRWPSATRTKNASYATLVPAALLISLLFTGAALKFVRFEFFILVYIVLFPVVGIVALIKTVRSGGAVAPTIEGSMGKGAVASLLFQMIALCVVVVVGGALSFNDSATPDPHRKNFLTIMLMTFWGILLWAMLIPAVKKFKLAGENRTLKGLYGMSLLAAALNIFSMAITATGWFKP